VESASGCVSRADRRFDLACPCNVYPPLTDCLAHHAFPLVACGNTSGDVRVAWFDNRTSFWNVYYRESLDGGNTFSPEVVLSNDDSAKLPWKSTSGMGFLWPFGDYGQMLVDSEGFTQAVWGEVRA
jgi:hypothetical protein